MGVVGGISAPAASAADEIRPMASGSSSTRIGDATLRSNIWIQQFTSNGCADFEGSAVISGGSAPRSGRDWVRLKITLDPWGVDASLKAFGRSGDPLSATWTNGRGQRGAYYGGNLCPNWRTLGVVGTSKGTAYYYGVTRSTTAST
jgi:hypothetical protein